MAAVSMPLGQAQRLYEDARTHGRALSYHRRMRRERMEELRRFCERNRIAFDEITRKGGVVDGQGQDEADST